VIALLGRCRAGKTKIASATRNDGLFVPDSKTRDRRSETLGLRKSSPRIKLRDGCP
jgi:hypothetical protein